MTKNLNLVISTFRVIASEQELEWLASHSHLQLSKLLSFFEHDLCKHISHEQLLDYIHYASNDEFERQALRKFFTCALKINCAFDIDSPKCKKCKFPPMDRVIKQKKLSHDRAISA